MESNKRKKQTTENFIKDVRRVFSSEQKIQIVMEAMRAELSDRRFAENTRLQMLHSTSGIKSSWEMERRV